MYRPKLMMSPLSILAAMTMLSMLTSPAPVIRGPERQTGFKKQSRRSFGKATRKSPHTKARCKWIGGQPLLFRP